jgi:hypothetical protein
MSYQDKSLKFTERGASFIFTSDEQDLHASKDLTSDPVRCAQWRASLKTELRDDGECRYRCRCRR